MPPVYLLGRRTASYLHGGLGDSKAHTLSWGLSEPRETTLDGKAGWKRASENEASSSTDTDEGAIATPTTAAVDPFPSTMSAREPFPTSSLGDLATALTDAELPPSLSSRGSGASATVDTTSATEPSVVTTPDVAVSSVVATATLETSVATEDPNISTPEQQAPTTVVIPLSQLPTVSVTTQDPTRTAETGSPLVPVETFTSPVLVTTETDDPVTTQTLVVKPTPQASVVPSLESTSSEEPVFTSPPEPQAPSFTARPTGASMAPNTSKATPEESSPSPAAPLPTTITQAEPAPDTPSNTLPRTEVSGTASQTLGTSIEAVPTEARPTSRLTITASTPLSAGNNNESASGSTEPVPSGTTVLVATTPSDAPFPAIITGSSDTLGDLPEKTSTTGTTTPLGPRPSGVILQAPRPGITDLTAEVPALPTAVLLTVSDSFSESVPLSVTSAVVSTFTSEIPIQTTDSDGRLTTSFSTTTGTTTLFTVVPNPSVSVTSASRSNVKIQGLIGGVVGGFILLLAAGFLAFICMRRRKYKKEMEIHARLFESPTETGEKFDSDNSPQVVQVRYLDLGTMAEDSAKAADTVASHGQYPFNPATMSPPTRPRGHYVLRKPPPSFVDDNPFADPELGSASPTGRYTPHHLTAAAQLLPGSAAQRSISASKDAVGKGQGEDPNPFTDPVVLIPSSNPFDDDSVPTKYLKLAPDKRRSAGQDSVSSDPGVIQVGYAL